MPDENDVYFLYQTLLGVFPFDEKEYPLFTDRMKNYMIKSVREAKRHIAWIKPDKVYMLATILVGSHNRKIFRTGFEIDSI